MEVCFNSNPSIKGISPVTEWGDSTEVALELLCPGTQERGYRFLSPTIYQQKCYNYCRKLVHMKHKCDDCDRLGIIVVRWSGPDLIARETWMALGEIEIFGFEPVDGLHMLKFVDPFKAETVNGLFDPSVL